VNWWLGAFFCGYFLDFVLIANTVQHLVLWTTPLTLTTEGKKTGDEQNRSDALLIQSQEFFRFRSVI
jgi:hypothetical protein